MKSLAVLIWQLQRFVKSGFHLVPTPVHVDPRRSRCIQSDISKIWRSSPKLHIVSTTSAQQHGTKWVQSFQSCTGGWFDAFAAHHHVGRTFEQIIFRGWCAGLYSLQETHVIIVICIIVIYIYIYTFFQRKLGSNLPSYGQIELWDSTSQNNTSHNNTSHNNTSHNNTLGWLPRGKHGQTHGLENHNRRPHIADGHIRFILERNLLFPFEIRRDHAWGAMQRRRSSQFLLVMAMVPGHKFKAGEYREKTISSLFFFTCPSTSSGF